MRERLAAFGGSIADHRRRVIIGAAAAAALLMVAAVIVLIPGSGDAPVDMHGYDKAVVTLNDIPARAFIGWEQLPAGNRPETSSVPSGMTADRAECVPGGDKQRGAEMLVLSGNKWGAAKFVNPAFAQTMTVSVSDSPNTNVAALDSWLNACATTMITSEAGGRRSTERMTLSSLPVQPAFYRLEVARVYAQAVTDAAGHTTTALTAYGRAHGVTIQVRYTFPGPATDQAIRQLDVVWRAQAAKLVGMQEAHKI